MVCNCCNSSNVQNGCKNNGYCLTLRCNNKTPLDLVININNINNIKNNKLVEVSFKNERKSFYKSNYLELKILNEIISSNKNRKNILTSSILKTKKNQNQVEIHNKIDRFDNIHI